MIKAICMIFVTVLILQGESQETDCNCYTLGTLGSIDGESICNRNTLQCKCYPNVIGKNCDQCTDGYYNIISGRGCSPCNCNWLGAKANTCDQITGQCSCKPGYRGFKCDGCDANICNYHGSENHKCSNTENCGCFHNFEGQYCDRCKENFYNIYEGCISCPPCYKFVKINIHTVLQDITITMKTIEKIERHFQSHIVDYKTFVGKVQRLKTSIEELKQKCLENMFSDSFELLQKLSQECISFNKIVNEFVENIKSNFSYDILKMHLYYVHTNMTETENLVNVCEQAYENATIISRNINRHNKTITNVAKEAMATAQRIEDRVQHLTNSASNKVLRVCNETCELHTKFIENNALIDTDMSVLKSEICNKTRNLGDMEIYLLDLHNKTWIVRNKAIKTQKEIQIFEIPDKRIIFNTVDKIKQTVDEVTDDIKNITKKGKEIKVKKDLMIDTLKIVKEKEKTLVRNIENANLLNDRSDAALQRVEKLKNEIEMAKENLLELEKLNSTMYQNVSQIRNKIDAVLNNSKEIKDIFETVTSTIMLIKQTDANLTQIVQNISANADLVIINLKIVSKLEQKQNEISKIIEEENLKLIDVKTELRDINKFQYKLEKNLFVLQEYLLVLNTLATINKQLNEVEKELNKFENMMNTIHSVRQQKNQLQKEVNNVKDIIENLPENDDTFCVSAENEPKLNLIVY